MIPQLFSSFLLLAAGISARAVPATPLTERRFPELVRRQNSSCSFAAGSRDCWSDGYDITTNWYTDWPDTGVVREYWLEVTNTTVAPDGVDRNVLAFNGTVPGPTLHADWGDTVRVHVTNKLTANGTSVHWHGMRQLNTNDQDGVNGITECPVAPGDSITYEWQATQYGTTWYHSHFSLQYGEGAAGSLIINGPASADYDVDLGPIMVSDWFHETIFSQWEIARTSPPNPAAQTGLINGTGVFEDGGSRWTTTFESGKKYRLRFLNPSVDTHWKLQLDGHNFTVIAADLVPITPFTTKYLNIGMGQRYDVIVEANKDVDNYWFRAYPSTQCGAPHENPLDVLGVIRYDGSSTIADPTTTDDQEGYANNCDDMPLASMVPVNSIDVPTADMSVVSTEIDVSIQIVDSNIIQWAVNDTSIKVDWSNPALMQLQDGQSLLNTTNTFILDQANEWVYFVIKAPDAVTHPIHLHGHDFSVLAQGLGAFDASTLNFVNPMRRDVAMLPGQGYLVIGFETDNPGSWIMHCHIAWHISGGLGMNFLERPDEILDTLNIPADWTTTCNNWSDYENGGDFWEQDDSGLKMI
ncbi:Cupredoxin [Geopyxis carbonaria]|nr:Cupredoxin [Geopyxis carbonaria]